MTIDLITPTEDILSLQDSPTHQRRLFATMKIKSTKDTTVQIDTGATYNVLKKSELTGTKYEQKINQTAQVLRMYNNSAINPVGKCKIQLQNPATRKKYKVHFTIIKMPETTSRDAAQFKAWNLFQHMISKETHRSSGMIHQVR